MLGRDEDVELPSIADALERWHNTGGFSCSFPEECADCLWVLAHAYAEVNPEIRRQALREAAEVVKDYGVGDAGEGITATAFEKKYGTDNCVAAILRLLEPKGEGT